MNKNLLGKLVLALGLTVAAVRAPAQVLVNNIVQIQISDGTIASINLIAAGSGYTTAPTITFTGGGGTGAAATAVITGGAVTSVMMTSGGTGYTGEPAVTFSGGGTALAIPSQASGSAVLNFPQVYSAPFQNEVYGQAGKTIGIISLASGTQPEAGFIYQFTANGLSIGETPMAAPPGTPAGIVYDPPLPGVYSFVSTTTDGDGNTAVSPAVRYFATGTAIVSPEAGGTPFPNSGQGSAGPGTLLPVGSSIILAAVSTPADGFISRIDFYTDWTGSTATSTLIGSNTKDIIYTPAGPSGATHVVKALAYDNNGVLVPSTSSLDQITITMTTPSPIGLPTCVINSPSNDSYLQIPSATTAGSGIPVLVSAAAKGSATISKVELYIDGTLYATDTSYPYTFNWTPTVTGLYSLTALAYDTVGNVVASTTSAMASQTPPPTTVTIAGPPAVAIVSPGDDSTINSGANTSVTAVATDVNVNSSGQTATITQVQFFQDGVFVGAASAPSSGTDYYTVSFKPTQKLVNGVVVPSTLTAEATDSDGFTGVSPGISVNVTSGGTGSNVVIGTPPTVTLATPTSGTNITVNTPVTFSASATAPNGNVAEVDFLVDGVIVASETGYPYQASYTFTNLGTYTVAAQVIDNLGDKTISPTTTVTVVTEPPPTVSVTSPSTGGVLNTGDSVTVTANASSPDGTIAQVQFYENGMLIGTATTPPYSVTFTPLSAGVYTLTAVATDNAGETTTSSTTVVEAQPATQGLGTVEYFGQYQGTSLSDSGRFAFIVVDGTYGTFIGHATSGAAGNTYYPDITVNSAGNFSTPNLTGSASVAGVSGNLGSGNTIYIGAADTAGGYYVGSLSGQPGSQVTAILGGDGSLMVYISNGTTSDVADGSIDTTGAFDITTQDGNTLTGTLNPTTGFVTGTLSGAAGGTILAAQVSGGTFSDGVMRNISTRGQVGSGANVMVAGFAVGGTSPKRLLIRAVGPTLSSFGLAGSLTGTQLQVFSGTTLFLSNTGWSSTVLNASAVTAADSQAGAFALPSGSLDSALIGTFAPGTYTAQISGLGGASGLALAEVYDLDAYTPFTPQRLTNVSTRGFVGTGNDVLIGGFSIDGTAPKRLLIRGAGPALTGMGVTGALAAAHIELMNSSGTTLRENFSWGAGNDPGLLAAAESATGAFAFPSGSDDAAMLVVIPPGTYTVLLSGAGGDTGVGLIEVYEVP